MSPLKTTILFLLLVVLETSLALICKHCNVNCEDTLDEECVYPGEEQEVACLTETFREDHSNKTLYQRKCVLYKKDTKFECADYPGYVSVSCVVCKTDRCNGAASALDRRNLTRVSDKNESNSIF